MKRREFLALAGAAAAFPRVAFAQQAAKVPRVALVSGAIAVPEMMIGRDVNWGALIQELADQGFVEGRTVTLDRYMLAGTTTAITQDNARIVLGTAPDAIFWGGATPSALAALAMNKMIPMVVETGDLLGQGVVGNLAHPGTNATGVSTTAGTDAEGKMLGLLAEAVPSAKTFAYTNSGTAGQFGAIKQAYVESVSSVASKLGLTMVPFVYDSGGGPAAFTKVFDAIVASKAEMVLLGTDTPLTATAQQTFVANLALKARLPAITSVAAFAEVGGLLAYGGDYPDLARRCADYVALVLRGANPGDLPVLQPQVFDLVVNQKTANAIGVTIPQSLLVQATEVIQ